jgi:predicted KAP-like P-loop ATPase
MEVVASTLMQAADADEGLVQKINKFSKRIDVLRVFGLVADAGATFAGFPTFGLLSKGAQSIGQLINGDGSQEDYQGVKAAVSDLKEKSQGLLKDTEKQTPPAEIAAFRKEFSEILGALGKTLVVFIDNIDRCLPKNAIQTLEAVRLFLFLPQSAFVIAADEEMINRREVFNNKVDGYLEHVVHSGLVRVTPEPPPSPQQKHNNQNVIVNHKRCVSASTKHFARHLS